VNNNNYPMLDVPEVNKAMDEAAAETDPAKRAEAWAEVDRLVMEQAAVAPYLWDKQASARSENVKGVINRFNATWDYSFTSLK
jgi:peptide/nickel transport system substrate-binding protein